MHQSKGRTMFMIAIVTMVKITELSMNMREAIVTQKDRGQRL